MNGFADFLENTFIGKKPHELSICITTGNLGDIRRFAVESKKEAKEICKKFQVVPKF